MPTEDPDLTSQDYARIGRLMKLRRAIAQSLRLPEAYRRYPQEEALISQYVVAFKIDELTHPSEELPHAATTDN